MTAKRIDVPTSQSVVRALRVGDEVELYGTIVTARDAAHKLMVESWPEIVAPALRDGAIYHCGPVMKKTAQGYEVVAAGPTTSIREEPYETAVMERYGVRLVIGKGGMGPATLAACHNLGAVYVHAVGGAAVALAACIKKVEAVHFLEELGVPEAFWVLHVEALRGVVTMDAAGHSLHEEVYRTSKVERDRLLGV
ncbi:MAG: FumA C-terminus/TtdB family hydratase beta subunit [Myxococcota bacterium]|jgi:fumarate hydratase class I|nr:FumA C-terminus/TtdB family hydratase beta subunit [Myxococcota bacterium]